MLNKGTTKGRLLKISDILDARDKKTNNEVLVFIKDIKDNEFYFIDDEGNKIPRDKAIIEHSIRDSKGKLIKPTSINIEIVDNSSLEGVMYSTNNLLE